MTNIGYGASIVGYDETCGPEIIVSKSIAGYPVLAIYGTIYQDSVFDYSSQLLSFEKLTSNDVENMYSIDECGIYERLQDAFFEVGVTSITLPDTIKYIGPYAFNNGLSYGSLSISGNANKINNLKLPKDLLVIGDYAFAYNSSLSEVTIGNGINFVHTSAFVDDNYTYKLISITFDKTCNEKESIFDYSSHTAYSLAKIYGSNNEVCK